MVRPFMQVQTPDKVKIVYSSLKQRILSLLWTIGDQLPTEIELAQEFGCHRSTVSKALIRLSHEGFVERKRRTGTRVVRNSIQQNGAIVELDAFAFLYPSDKHENIWKIAQGFQGEANAHQRRAMMFATGPDFRKEAEIISRLAEFDIRGAAIYPMVSCQEEGLALLQMVAASKFPLVLVGQTFSGCACPAVEIDGFHIGHTMTKYLIETGSTRIGFFTNNANEQSRRDMYKGYLWALDEAGLTVKKNWALLEKSMHPNFEDPLLEPVALGRAYLGLGKEVEAVVCGDDYLAIGLMQAAREHGLSLPEDLRITGSDDLPLAAASRPPLTTYGICPKDVGRTAFQLLNDFVSHPQDAPLSIGVRGSLVVRESA